MTFYITTTKDSNYLKDWLVSYSNDFRLIHFEFEVKKFSSFLVNMKEKTIFHSYKTPNKKEPGIIIFDFNEHFNRILELIDKEYKPTMEQKELKITKEKVLEAANKCSQAKETLKTLFPEVFENDKYVDFTDKSIGYLSCIAIREQCEFAKKSFYLCSNYNWEIKKDTAGALCLIPTKK